MGYQNTHIYDVLFEQMQPDVPFYRAICDTLKPRSILEIGVGSGRLVPHLCHNSNITHFYGIDIEPRMIQKAKEKTFLGCESCEMSFIEADMRNFHISKRFDLVILGSSVLKHLENKQERLQTLQCAKEHLSETGYIAIDHSPYLYYQKENSDWQSYQVTLADWWPLRLHDHLAQFEWKKEIVNHNDRLHIRHLQSENTITINTYLYPSEELKMNLKAVKLQYFLVANEYLPDILKVNGQRFMALLTPNMTLNPSVNRIQTALLNHF